MPVHSDYIRAGECAPNDPNIFCSGDYDNQINVLDMRASEITMSFDHGQPIESIFLFPSMSLIVSTGGSLIKGKFYLICSLESTLQIKYICSIRILIN